MWARTNPRSPSRAVRGPRRIATPSCASRATARSMDWIFDPAHRGEAVALYREHVKESTDAEAVAAIESLVQEKEGFARGARLDPAGMANVLKIRSEFAQPQRTLTDVSRYIDESILREARP